MPGDFLEHRRRGEDFSFPADAYNAFVDTARAHRRGRAVGTGLPFEARGSTIVRVRNTTGEPLDQFAIVRLVEPTILPADNEDEFRQRICLDVLAPGDPALRQPIAVLLEALAAGPDDDEENGAIGLACVAGVVQAQVAVASGETDWQWAEPIEDDSTKLKIRDQAGPARILWKESGTGDKWALVFLNQHTAGFWGIVGCRRDASGTWQYAFVEALWDDETDTPPIAKPGGRFGYTAQSAVVERTTTGTASAAEVQLISFCGPPTTAGSYTISGSSSITHNSDAAAVQTAVRAALGGTLVTVSGSFASGFTITWPANGAQSLLTVDVSGLSPAGPVTPAYEVNNQKVKPGVVAWFEYDWEFGCFRFAAPFKACGGVELPGLVAGRKNWVYVDSDGCWKVTPGNTDCA